MKQSSVIKEYTRKLRAADEAIADKKNIIKELESKQNTRKQDYKDKAHDLKLESQQLANSLRDQHVQKLETELKDKQAEITSLERMQKKQAGIHEQAMQKLNSALSLSENSIKTGDQKIKRLELSISDIEESTEQRMRKMSDNIHVLEAHANSPKHAKEPDTKEPSKSPAGVYVEIKFDGTHCQIHKEGDKVAIYSEDGQDYTKNCPTLISELRKHRDDFVVCAELESWKDKVHQPRATTAGILNSKEVHADESTLRANVFDCLYKGVDIHNMPYCERLEALAGTKDTAHFIKNDRKVCRTEDELRKAINSAADEPGSEGAYLKTTDFKYELDRKTLFNIKYKVELSCDVQVIRVNKAGTVWNYDCALKGRDGLAYVGVTYNTSLKAAEGDILKVAFVDISGYKTKAGKKWARWYSPHVIQKRTDKKTPDSVDTAWRMAKETTGRFEDKEEPAIMKDFGLWPLPEEHQDILIDPDKYYDSAVAYLIENPDRCQWLKKGTSLPTFIPENKADEVKDWLLEDVRILEKDKPQIFMDVCILWDGTEVKLSGAMRDSKIIPNSFSAKGKKRFVIHNHFRGASSHLDARFEMDKFLEGFTIACANESKITEPVLTMADGKKLMDDSSIWKLDLKTGEEKVRKGTGGRETAEKLWSSFKSKQPVAWIDVKGTTPKRDDDPGTAGGTKQYPGVFVVVDKGTFDRGASKSYYKEYFLNGPKWKGRYIFRQVSGLKGSKKPLTWLYWKATDITPYSLSSRAVRENWMPKGYSALPSQIEQKVPGDLNYWKPGLTSQQRLDRRKALRKHFLKQKEFSIIEQDFIKPTKPYLDMDAHQSNEFFMLKDMKDFDYTNKILETKWDGLRMQVHKKGNSVKCYSAYGNQWPLKRMGHIPEEIRKIDSYSFILDGELILPDKDRDVVHDAITSEGSDDFEYMVFDILQVNDNRMIKSTLKDRKRVLHRMTNSSHVKLTRPVIVTKDNIKPLLQELQKRGYEGAVIKDLNSEYQDRKSWHKFVFISNYLKPIEELDELDNEHLNNYRIALRRLERKLKEGKTIPISTDELYKQKDKVAELMTRDHASPKFTLTRRYWRGADVVRRQDVQDFHLKLECPAAYKFHLDKNPVNTDSVTAVQFTEGGKYFRPGEYAPNSDINPNKKIPAYIESICTGAFEVLVEQDKLMQVKFKGKNLNGMYVFRRTSPKDTMWSMEKQASPKLHRRSITFSIKDFSAGEPKISSDITFPYKRRTIAFAPGIWHDTVYSWDVVKRSADKFLGVPIVIEHSEDIMDDIGTVTEVFVNEEKQRIEVEFELIDTENGKDTAILLENNKINAVSTGLDEWSQTMNGMETCSEIVNIRHVAVVGSPEVRTALICDKDGDCH